MINLIKQKFNIITKGKKVTIFMQLILLIAILFCVIDQSNLARIKYLFENFNFKDIDVVILQLGMPTKTIFDISNFVSLFCIIILFFVCIIFPIVLFCFFERKNNAILQKNKIDTINKFKFNILQKSYILHKKLLC